MTYDELPTDPDWDHVPLSLRELDGQPVALLTADGVETAVLVIVPELFGNLDRLRRDFYTDEPGDTR